MPRPKFKDTLEVEKNLKDKGFARLGVKKGKSPMSTRTRMYLIAKRMGMSVKTHEVQRGAVHYVEATVKPQDEGGKSKKTQNKVKKQPPQAKKTQKGKGGNQKNAERTPR